MKNIISTGLALIGALTVINSAEAQQPHKDKVNSKPQEQTLRIHQDVKSAAPTAIEAGKPVTKAVKTETNVRKPSEGVSHGAKVEKQERLSRNIVHQK